MFCKTALLSIKIWNWKIFAMKKISTKRNTDITFAQILAVIERYFDTEKRDVVDALLNNIVYEKGMAQGFMKQLNHFSITTHFCCPCAQLLFFICTFLNSLCANCCNIFSICLLVG